MPRMGSMSESRPEAAGLMPLSGNVQRTLLALLVAVLVVLPLALHLPMYLDDHLRAVKGVSKWSRDGRPIASLLWQIITLNAPDLKHYLPLVRSCSKRLILKHAKKDQDHTSTDCCSEPLSRT